jgi:ribonuclease BN (tRNA processing enzyme)
MNKSELIVLGSCSGVSSPTRAHQSLVLNSGKVSVMLDCGEPAGARYMQENLRLNDLRHIVISHSHIDHCGSLPMLLKTIHLLIKVNHFLFSHNLTVHMPQELINGFVNFLEVCHMPVNKLAFPLILQPVQEGEIELEEGVSLQAIRNRHLTVRDDTSENVQGQSYSFKLDYFGDNIVYSGDVAEIGELDELLRVPVDLLIVEFGHLFPLTATLRHLAQFDISQILVNHIHPDYDDKGIELQHEADSFRSDWVKIGYDGLRIPLRGHHKKYEQQSEVAEWK